LPQTKAKAIAGNWSKFWQFIEPYLTGEQDIKNDATDSIESIFKNESYSE
jgi:hypothetical protein